MPTCPGCGECVQYSELRSHVRTCRFVWSEAPERTDRLTQRLARQVARLEERLGAGELDETELSTPEEGAEEPDLERHQLR